MSFNDAWRAFHGEGAGKASGRLRADREYVSAEADGYDLSRFPAYATTADKTGRDFCGLLTSFCREQRLSRGTSHCVDLLRAEDLPAAPLYKLVATPVRLPTSMPKFQQVPALVEPGAFDSIWEAWPKNSFRERVESARAAFDEAAQRFPVAAVITACRDYIDSSAGLGKPLHMRTFLERELAACVAALPSAEDQEQARVDISLYPGSPDADAPSVAAWCRSIKPTERLAFRCAVIAYAKRRKKLAREMGEMGAPRSWSSFVGGAWREVDNRKVAMQVLKDLSIMVDVIGNLAWPEGLGPAALPEAVAWWANEFKMDVPKLAADMYRQLVEDQRVFSTDFAGTADSWLPPLD